MKKKNILIPFSAALIALTGCNYNEKNFDGLFDNTRPTEVLNISYTLTPDDYATIANNSTNKALAEAAGVAGQLSAIASKGCLTDVITAKEYIPAFLSARWYTADEGSSIKVTYQDQTDAPGYLGDIEDAATYVVTNADYEGVWDESGVNYFSPSKPASLYLPRILRNAVADASSGEYVVVEYNYSSTDPSSGGEEPGASYNKISDVIDGPNGEYTCKGTVAAAYARGFLLTDGTGTILVYQNAATNLSLGDVVIVKGTTTVYSGAKQFGQAGLEVTRESASETFEYPTTAKVMSAADMDAYVANSSNAPLQYVEYTGTLSISGNYYNIAIEGATTAIGSIAYPSPGVVSPELNGKEVTIKGYSVGVSSGKYFNTMVTSISEVDGTAPTSIGVVALAEVGDYTVQGQIVAEYARGFLLNDGTGSILVYLNATSSYAVGSSVRVSGAVTKYAGLKQYSATAEITQLTESGTVTYPTAAVMTDTELDDYIVAPFCRLVTYSGTLTISGNYYNIILDDALTAQGSLAYPIAGTVDTELNGKKVVVKGYAVGTSSGKYVNTMVLSVEDASTPESRAAMTRAAVTEKQFALYTYNGSSWAVATDASIVNPADYSSMGISSNSFSSSYDPDNYIPQYLKLTYPYAQNGDVKTVAYYYTSNSVTTLNAVEYTFDNGNWTKNDFIETKTDQFVFNGKVWNYDPSIIIRLKKGDAYSKEFMQVTVDSVKVNMGDEYIDSYGTAEFYYGSSAYYGNVDITPAKWKQYSPYSSMTDEEVEHTIAEHAQSGIFVYSLKYYHADMAPIDGIDVTVTITYDTYNSAASAGVFTIQYLVTGKGQFEYIPDSYQQVE